jgi:hypothetical protein
MIIAMSEQEQRPHFQELHSAFLEAIKKYETSTRWSVVELKLTAKKGVSDVEITVIPSSPDPR